MDLNTLYSKHQISLMRAAAAGNRQSATAHLDQALNYASLIRMLRGQLGATALPPGVIS